MKLREFFICIAIFIFFSCAAIGPAGGGLKDLNGPKLIKIEPSNGSTQISTSQKIILTFNESIDPNSVISSIRLNPEIDISISIKKNIISISPKKNWNIDKQFRINIDRNIRDYQENSMSSPIDLNYSTSTKLSNGKIYGKLANYNPETIYDVGLFNFPKRDSLELVVKTQTNEFGEFGFDFLKRNKYILIANEKNINNIYNEINFSKYGINTIDFINIDRNDSVYTQIYLDDPLKRLEIQSGKMIGNNIGKIYYSNGEEDIFYYNKKQNYTYPSHIKIYEKGLDTLSIKSNLKNRLTSYYTKNIQIINQTFIDTIAPKILGINYLKEKINFEFNESINLKTDNQKYIYYLNSDSIKVELKYNKTNPFTLSVENNNNFDVIYIEQNILMDEANNTYPDSLTSIPIERSENNLIITNNKSYGQLSGLINNINLDVMIEATNIDEDISYLTKSKNMNFYFDSLKPGNYKLRAFEILNNKNDSIYFSGKINPYQRAAKFAIYPEIISIRSRWEIEGINIRF